MFEWKNKAVKGKRWKIETGKDTILARDKIIYSVILQAWVAGHKVKQYFLFTRLGRVPIGWFPITTAFTAEDCQHLQQDSSRLLYRSPRSFWTRTCSTEARIRTLRLDSSSNADKISWNIIVAAFQVLLLDCNQDIIYKKILERENKESVWIHVYSQFVNRTSWH